MAVTVANFKRSYITADARAEISKAFIEAEGGSYAPFLVNKDNAPAIDTRIVEVVLKNTKELERDATEAYLQSSAACVAYNFMGEVRSCFCVGVSASLFGYLLSCLVTLAGHHRESSSWILRTACYYALITSRAR
jgi:hypothetical protein